MVSYISVGELRRLQSLSGYREEQLPAAYAAYALAGAAEGSGTSELPTSRTQATFLKQKENIHLRSFRAFLRRERRYAAHRLKQARAERAREGRLASSPRDEAGIVVAAGTAAGSEQAAGAEHAAADALVAGPGDISSVPSSTSEEEEEDDEDESGEEARKRTEKEKQEAEKHIREAQNKIQSELAYMRLKIPELLQRRQYADAEHLLGYYLQRFPRLPELYLFSIQLYMRQRRYGDAIDMCWAGLFCAPGDLRFSRSLRLAEDLLLQQVCRVPQKYKAALFNLSSSFLQDAQEKEEKEAVRRRLLGDSRFITMKQGGRICCVANTTLEPGDLVVKERPYVATPMLLVEELLDPCGPGWSSKSGNSSSVQPVANGSSDAQGSSSRRTELRLFTTCFHCLQERRTPDRGFACTESPYTCPFVFCSWECLMRNGRVHAVECALLPFVFAAAKESHVSPTSVLHFFRFLTRVGLERDQGVPAIRAAEPAAGGGGAAAASAQMLQQQRGGAQLDMLDRLFSLPSLRRSVEDGQPELYHRICLLMRRVQKELHARQYCFLKHEELVEAMLLLLQHSPPVVSGSAAAALSRRDPTAAVGLVFAGATAALPHSCIPTCCVDFSADGGEVSVRTICHVPAGGSLCICMEPDLFEPTSSRKKPYALPCVFACGCSRCSDPTEHNRYLRGIRCSVCNRGYCNPNNSPSLLLRLRAYGSGGPLRRHKFYWQKIWTEQQEKYMREGLLTQQQQQQKGLPQQRQWQRRPGGPRVVTTEVQEAEEEEERTGVRPAHIRELLQQIDAGAAAAARVFAEDDPYKILAEVLRKELRSRAAATVSATNEEEEAAAGTREVIGEEATGPTTKIREGGSGRRGKGGKGGGLSAHTMKVSSGVTLSVMPVSSSTAAASSSSASAPSPSPSSFSASSPFAEALQARADEEEETWQCNFCGRASTLLSAQCRAIEQRVCLLGAAATAALQRGRPLAARLLLQVIIDRYSVVLHPHHWRLYDAHVVAAGLWLSQPQQQLDQALSCMRRATIAAAAVLPVCYREKVLLYTRMAELQFTHMQQQKVFNRVAALPPAAAVLEPLYAALHNAAVCCGKNSALALTCMHRIRIYAGALGRATPPLSFTLHLRPIPAFLVFYRSLFGRAAGSDEEIKQMVEEDPFQVAAAIARKGFCDDIAMDLLKSFCDMYHLPSGLSPVALAAAAAHVPLVKRMLQAGFDFLTTNEWGVTPLLAMAACPLPATPAAPAAAPAAASSPSFSFSCFARSSEAAAVDNSQAVLLRLFLRACDERDAAARPAAAAAAAATAASLAAAATTTGGGRRLSGDGKGGAASSFSGEGRRLGRETSARELLLQARTHRLLGLNGVLHLAAARGKREVCKQLLRSGQSCFAANGEGATPLHLAAFAADAATVQVLLDYAAASLPNQRSSSNARAAALVRLVNARTERGETPLMLAVYGLQRDVASLLLERGADVNAVAHREQLTVFHALAVGICRDYEVQQQPLDLRGDGAAAVLVGLNDYSLSAGIYTRSNNTPLSPLVAELQLEDTVDLRVPLVSRLPADLLLFPQQLLLRLTQAADIVQLLLAAPYRSSTLRHLTQSGYSAEQLLLKLWQQLLHRRALLLERSEVRLATLSRTQREEIEKGWEEAGQLVCRIRELLTVAQAVAKVAEEEARAYERRETPSAAAAPAAAGEAAEEDEETPRPEDVAYRRQKQLEREAPWLFFEERAKEQKQQAAAASAARRDEGAAAGTAGAKLPPGKADAKAAPAGAEATKKAAAVAAAPEGAGPAATPGKTSAGIPAGLPPPTKGNGKADAAAGLKKLEGKVPVAVPKKDGSAAGATAPTLLPPTPSKTAVPSPPPAPSSSVLEGQSKGALPPPKKAPAKGPPLKLKAAPPQPKTS